MRFTSIVSFMKFIQFLEGLGYIYPGSLYELQGEIKKLPYYISTYNVRFEWTHEEFTLILMRYTIIIKTITMEHQDA